MTIKEMEIMTPEEFQKERELSAHIISMINKDLDKKEEEAMKSPFPEKVREATASDITEGAILWYKDLDDGEGWVIIDEVYKPNDSYEAYCGHDGCRYGLDGAFVRI